MTHDRGSTSGEFSIDFDSGSGGSPGPKAFTVGRFMTENPQRVAVDVSLAAAHEVLKGGGIRHLAVVDGARLVGIVSLTDLYFAERGSPGRWLTVGDAMEQAVVVAPDAPLEKVAEQMAREKVSAVLVVAGPRIVGIFTVIDALRALTWLATPPDARSVYETIRVATCEPTRT